MYTNQQLQNTPVRRLRVIARELMPHGSGKTWIATASKLDLIARIMDLEANPDATATALPRQVIQNPSGVGTELEQIIRQIVREEIKSMLRGQ